jgi:hypothetical protein
MVMSAFAFAFVVPIAAADSVYHPERLRLSPVGDAPLRSGFVLNIKAEGPVIYAHEIYVLNGALANETFTVTNNFYFLDPGCVGAEIYPEDLAVVTTGPSGNARADAFFAPTDVEGFEGVSGVIWTLRNSVGEIVYRTRCTAVTLD